MKDSRKKKAVSGEPLKPASKPKAKTLSPHEFHEKTPREEILAMCERAGTTFGYWLHIKDRRKRPGVDLARALVEASGGRLSLDGLLIPREQLRKTGAAPIGGRS